MPELDFITFAIIFAAIGVGSLVKGLTGFGMPLIAIPFMAPYIGLDHALAVMVIPSISSNLWIMWVQKKHKPAREVVLPVILFSFLTIGIGVWVLTLVSKEILLGFMGFWLLAYLGWNYYSRGRVANVKNQNILGPVIGLCAGFTQGTTGITTPFVVTYLHTLKLEPRTYTYANAVIYQAFWLGQAFFLWAFGLFDLARLCQGFLALIPMALFLPIGIHFTGRVKPQVFDKIIIFLMVILSARLFWAAWGM